jgi:hypothetical protein
VSQIRIYACEYNNGWPRPQWPGGPDGWVNQCELSITDDGLELSRDQGGSFARPWGVVDLSMRITRRGNALLKVRHCWSQGRHPLGLDHLSPNAFWADLWRFAPRMHRRVAHLAPELLPTSTSQRAPLTYLGGYLLSLTPEDGYDLRLNKYGVELREPAGEHSIIFLPWKDIYGLDLIEGIPDGRLRRRLDRWGVNFTEAPPTPAQSAPLGHLSDHDQDRHRSVSIEYSDCVAAAVAIWARRESAQRVIAPRTNERPGIRARPKLSGRWRTASEMRCRPRALIAGDGPTAANRRDAALPQR